MPDETIRDVKSFWESNPLFSGESSFPPGSKGYFEEHRSLVIECFLGEIDRRVFPEEPNNDKVLDLGCGPGVWTIELSRSGARHITAADLTETALHLTRRRAEVYGVEVETSQQNAEDMTFPDESFSHVNCQGVIHHTPNTEACVREMARVLRPDGTAFISVYYLNICLRHWPWLRHLGRIFSMLGGGMKGRGREGIFGIRDPEEIVRLYDGDRNPIGRAYSRQEFINMLSPYFRVEELFLHYFPVRALPFRIPRWLHRTLDRRTGFMICAKCRKPAPSAKNS